MGSSPTSGTTPIYVDTSVAETRFFRQAVSAKLLKEVRIQLQEEGLPFAFYIAPATQ